MTDKAALRAALGLHVKRTRVALCLRQDELAARCNVTVRTIYRIERGATNVTIDTIAALAAILGCTAAHLLKVPD